ncbi:probable UDP-3-O-acylglucosamine N-acyltransferase 2, mitochondrial isoform X3 [Rhodamnia argentea]|uniref:Probable UDP-3-O-acylglucosamine N-acyltransferase 2, mitochondrial isoform X3 n=1 Tax=Rhodamnia argentea TaxID=178133 RepID=A0A8B8N4S7_9MYRT|nr:probable UDP-3-O-acylglucosamine N-acyltransferase 2, mitochondrial isoform X3 [Rhodamnia argentea]
MASMAVRLRKLAPFGAPSSVPLLLSKTKHEEKLNLFSAFAMGNIQSLSTCSVDASSRDGQTEVELSMSLLALIQLHSLKWVLLYIQKQCWVHMYMSDQEQLLDPLLQLASQRILGFGFLVDESGNMLKKPQMLIARIGDHVEIGANTCIDRGSWRDTVIGDWSKIDNLVQIGHNAVIGKSCILCGQVGIAGSATLGDYVTLGGRAAVRDHVSITSKVRLAANSCVIRDIKEPGDYGGFPAVPIGIWRRQVVSRGWS